MKKIFVLAAVAALVTAVSCNKIDGGSAVSNDAVQQEISIMNVANMTKGYVEGTTFGDTKKTDLHNGTGATEWRDMKVSAYLSTNTTSTGGNVSEGNYFVGKTFKWNVNDGIWHGDPIVYWPLAGKLSFLAYSTKDVTLDGTTAVHWDSVNASDQVVLDVPEECSQDDILYAGVPSNLYNQATNTGTVSPTGGRIVMEFGHAQAWLEFVLKVADGMPADVIHINSITIENIYNRGELTIKRDDNASKNGATATWNFRKETSHDVEMDDVYKVTEDGNFLTGEPQYMDMLIPEQGRTSFLIEYTLEGSDEPLTYRYELSDASWLKNYKYIYNVTISLYEITVDPSVTIFGTGDVADFDPNNLV